MDRIIKYQEQFEECLLDIERLMTPNEYNQDELELFNWLYHVNDKVSGYLPPGHNIENAFNFLTLLEQIHHAVVDDGDLCFIKIDGQPRMLFLFPYEFSKTEIAHHAMYYYEKDARNHISTILKDEQKPIDIEILNIKPNEFPKIVDDYQREEVKRYFLSDCRRGVETAKSYYAREYPEYWDDAWIEEGRAKYEKYKKAGIAD